MRRITFVLLLLASTLLSLAAAEAVLRLAGFSYPSFHRPDPLLGTRLRAGTEGWSRKEGEAYVRINSAGMHDEEVTLAKPPKTLRVAVLGDSFMEAVQVPQEATFASRLEERLAACPRVAGQRVETLNFGVANYGTAQQLLQLREHVWQYSPDMVVLAFFAGNDVRNNSPELERGRQRPFFLMRDGELVLDTSFAEDEEFRDNMVLAERLAPLQNIRLYHLLRKARSGTEVLRHGAPLAVALAQGDDLPPALSEEGINENVLREPPDDAWRNAWQVTDGLLARMAAEVRARGVPFVVVTIPPGGVAYPDRELRERYARQLGEADLFYPERRVRGVGEAAGFPVAMLGPALQAHADATGRFLYGFPNAMMGFGHWNEEGHRVAANVAAPSICAALG